MYKSTEEECVVVGRKIFSSGKKEREGKKRGKGERKKKKNAKNTHNDPSRVKIHLQNFWSLNAGRRFSHSKPG
jgi:hypothetical protein